MNALRPADARHEIENLLGRYAEAADERDAETVACLLDRAVLHFAGTDVVGCDDIRTHYARLFASAPLSRHLITNVFIETNGDEVRFRCRYTRWQIEPTAELLAIGEYAGTCSTRDSGSYITSFAVSRSWQKASVGCSCAVGSLLRQYAG